MKNQNSANEKDSRNKENNNDTNSIEVPHSSSAEKKDINLIDKSKNSPKKNVEVSTISNKPVRPPKLEDKPFEEFINKHLIPKLKSILT